MCLEVTNWVCLGFVAMVHVSLLEDILQCVSGFVKNSGLDFGSSSPHYVITSLSVLYSYITEVSGQGHFYTKTDLLDFLGI
jgi:hypothetical protein